MNCRSTLLPLVLICCLAGQVFSIDPDSCRCHETDEDSASLRPLKILSWNIYMLPVYVFETGAKYKRARGIAAELLELDYDIIVFQEAFHASARTLIGRRLHKNYPFQYGPGNNGISVRANSGIWIVSRIPLCNQKQIRFKRCKGTDAMSRKGAMLLEGCWYGHAFQIVGTHLQADAPFELRESQFRQISRELLIPGQKKGVPQFICGDMNTCYKNCEEYDNMLSILSAKDGPLINDSAGTSSSGEIIDYILVRSTHAFTPEISRQVRHFTHQWAAGKKWLSDHKAVDATIWFKRRKPHENKPARK